MNTNAGEDAEVPQENVPNRVWSLYIGAGTLFLLYWILGHFDNFTELTPDHNNSLLACFAIAGLSGLASASVAVHLARRSSISVKVRIAISIAILGCISVFLASTRVADLANGAVDFPAAKTRSFNGFLLISRAYQTHGKGRSWDIQTMPIWSNLDISERDYQFMLKHRRPGDDSRNPDEISSRGYFCARVTIEQSGNALRVMHAGSHPLPEGAVIVCPRLDPVRP